MITSAQASDMPPEGRDLAALCRLLCAAQLLRARIQTAIAIKGAQALTAAGWTTPQKMLEAEVRCLN
jgi:hypothetical protein